MRLAPEIIDFIRGPVLMTLGTRDAANRPMVARGSDGRPAADGSAVDIAVSAYLWPETVANLAETGVLAATFVRPDDYRAFQIKGPATLHAAGPAEAAAASAYVRRTRAVLIDLSVPAAMVDYWLTDREVVIARLTPERVFEQTPGPRAGRVVA